MRFNYSFVLFDSIINLLGNFKMENFLYTIPSSFEHSTNYCNNLYCCGFDRPIYYHIEMNFLIWFIVITTKEGKFLVFVLNVKNVLALIALLNNAKTLMFFQKEKKCYISQLFGKFLHILFGTIFTFV